MDKPTHIERAYLMLTAFATALALCVVILGVLARLSDADAAGWDVIHRYAAATLGSIILVMAATAWWRRQEVGQPVRMPLMLVPVVLLQGVLGMLTVTSPLTATLHLFAGMTILSWLWLLVLRQTGWMAPPRTAAWSLRLMATVAFGLFCLQLLLGGWVSSSHSAAADRAHHILAPLVALGLGVVAVAAIRTGQREWRLAGALVLAALLTLFGAAWSSGVAGLSLAVVHNVATAALLLAGTTLLSSLNGYGRVRS